MAKGKLIITVKYPSFQYFRRLSREPTIIENLLLYQIKAYSYKICLFWVGNTTCMQTKIDFDEFVNLFN